MYVHRALEYAQIHRDRFVRELNAFLRFPSVSSQPRHAYDIRRCSVWLASHAKRIGLESVRIIPTKKHPLVYGEWLKAPRRPTLLIYGHFDVQPPDPLREWQTPPFEPAVREHKLYARGASDDKGQLFLHLKAIESLLRTARHLPLNIRCIFEGEEEIGSPNLPAFLLRNATKLRSDVAVVSDTRILGPDRPALHYAERGALSVEVQCQGPAHDLHSGSFGGAIHNPLQALCEILAKIHDSNGHIQIPGFYDHVLAATRSERKYMRNLGPSDKEILRDAETRRPWGEPEFTLYERTTLRPSIALNGIVGGYQGPGSKSVIPARASAKLNFRLVSAQEPMEVARLFRQFVRDQCPKAVRCSVLVDHGANPALLNPGHPAFRAAAQAYQRAFGVAPVFLRSGGTIPIVNRFRDLLHVPTVLLGFALPDANLHGPNENLHLPTFERGIATSIWFMHLVSLMSLEGFRGKQVRRWLGPAVRKKTGEMP